MVNVFFALIALGAAWFITVGLCTLRMAGYAGAFGRDVLVGGVCLLAGVLLAIFGYVCRPQ